MVSSAVHGADAERLDVLSKVLPGSELGASLIVTNTLRQHPGGFSLAFLFTTEYFVTPGVNGGWAEWVATVAMGRAL